MAARQRRTAGMLCALALLASSSVLFLSAQAPQQIGTWAPSGTIADGRTGAASVALPDGTTLIAGGLVDGTPSDTVLRYDPATNGIVTAGQLLSARVGHTATLLEDGRVLVIGGRIGDAPTGDIEVLDPETGGSAALGQLSQPRAGHAAARIADGIVLVVGGATADGVVLDSVERVDVATGNVTAAPNRMLHARAYASATTLIDGRVLVAGGNDGNTDLRSAELYLPWTQGFVATETELSVPRSAHSAVLLPHNAAVLIAGGSSDGDAQASVDLFVPTEAPDPFSFGMGTFAATGNMAAARVGAATGPGRDGYAWIDGGGSTEPESYRFATIKTDRDDYAPGQTALITGSGWMPGEDVRLVFQEDPPVHDDYVLTLTADAQGNISWDQWAPEQHDIGVRFYLLASDSRSRAQTTFTDGNLSSTISLTVLPGSVAPGGALNWSIVANCADGGGPNTCASEGYTNGSAVQNGYSIEIQQATNATFTAGLVVRATATTLAGAASGTFTAPPTGGPYFYRARHDNQNLANVPVLGNNPNSWQPQTSNTVTVTLLSDTTAPTTTKTVGTPKFGAGDFYVTGTTPFTLSCADNAGGTGCAATFYQIVTAAASCPSNTNEALWTSYSAAFTLPAPDGEVRVCYFSKDTAGNREAPKFQNHFRDTAAPTSTATATANAAAYTSGAWTKFNVTVNLNATDGSGNAGVKEITYAATGATTIASTTVAGASVTGLVFSAEGTTMLTFFAKDNVNNTETTNTFTIRIDKTAPVIADLGPTSSPNGAGWYNSDVTNRFKATDALSGLDAACLAAFPDVSGERIQSKTTSGEGSAVTVASDSCTDAAGNTAAALTSAEFKIDKTAPVIVQHDFSPAANAAGWHNMNVSVRFKATDGLSGLNAACLSVFVDVAGERLQTKIISAEGAAVTTTSDSCTDVAGNMAVAITSTAFKIDKTAPVIVQHDFSPAANAAGWHNTDVVVRFRVTETVSGLDAACSTAFPLVGSDYLQSKTTSAEGLAVTVASDGCTDVAGNAASAVTSTAFKIDKVAPSIVDLGPTTSPNAAGWYNTDVINRFKASDGLSGLDGACLAAFAAVGSDRIQSKTTTGEGTAIVVTSNPCADEAGNTATGVTSAAFKIDKTAPVIVQHDFSPAANAAGWHNTDVVVRFKVTETVSGLDAACSTAFPLVGSDYLQSRTTSGEGLAVTVVSDSCTDVAGNAASAVTSTAFKIDKVAPSIVDLGPTTSPNAAGWYNTDVINRFKASDGLSGLDGACLAAFAAVGSDRIQSKTTTGEGTAIVVTSNPCADEAGNTATGVTSAAFKIDKTAPVIVQLDFSPAANAAGWHNTNVTVRFRVTENLSGLDAVCQTAFPLVGADRIQSKTTSAEGVAVTTASNSCADVAGNIAGSVTSSAFKIDKTAPAVAIVSPANGSMTIVLTIAANGTASDGLSGIKSVTLNGVPVVYNSGTGTWVTATNVALACGPNTLTALAVDNADLSSSASVTVTRLCFTFEYLRPLEQSYVGGMTVVNDGKYGRVIPVKGIVRRNGVVQSEADLVGLGLTLRIGVNAVPCTGGAATDAVEEYADAGLSNGGTNIFRWTLDGLWIYNLDTKAPPSMTMAINNCYRLDAYVQDAGTPINKVKISESPYAIFKPVK